MKSLYYTIYKQGGYTEKMYTLTSDSAIDVFRSKADELGIYIIPLTYTVDGNTIEDFAENESEYKKFYDDLKNGSMPVTSQINPFSHEEFWEKIYAENKNDIVHLTLSSGLSQTYASACKAAQSFKEKHPEANIYIVDSLGATQAETPVLEKAIELRDAGVGAAEAAEALSAYAHRIQVYIIVDDLFHLKRGGRISAASAVVGSVMGIKPIIVFDDAGKLATYKKPLGWKKALKTVLDHIEEYCPDPAGKKIWLAHADCIEKAEETKAAIQKRFGSEVQIGWIGPVIGSHINRGTIGVVFEANSRLNIKA